MTPLDFLHKDFKLIGRLFEQMTAEIIDSGVTRYPVIIASQERVGLGVPVVDAAQHQTAYSYRCSFIEELAGKGVIVPGKIAEFKKTYQNPLDKACFLLVQPNNFQIVFIPYEAADQS